MALATRGMLSYARAYNGFNRCLFGDNSRRSSSTSTKENDEVNPEFINRNPRNLEMLRIARKPKGYHLERLTYSYWYRLEIDQGHYNTTGLVKNNAGETVISASTIEWPIRSKLYNTTDVSAHYNIGRVLARRCLQSGFIEMHTELLEAAEKSDKTSSFLKAFKESGIELSESPEILAPHMYLNHFDTMPWTVPEEEVLKNEDNEKLKK